MGKAFSKIKLYEFTPSIELRSPHTQIVVNFGQKEFKYKRYASQCRKIMKQQAEALAAMASEPRQLLQHYVEKADNQKRLQAEDGLSERPDWIYDVGKLDQHGVLDGFPKQQKCH